MSENIYRAPEVTVGYVRRSLIFRHSWLAIKHQRRVTVENI